MAFAKNLNEGEIILKILVSSNGEKSTDLLDSRFGRCDYFQIYDTEKDEYKVLENKGNSSPQGAGVAASQQAIDQEVDIIITGKLGPNAFNLISNSDIKMYSASEVTVEEAIKLYKEGKLEEVTKSGPAHHGMKG